MLWKQICELYNLLRSLDLLAPPFIYMHLMLIHSFTNWSDSTLFGIKYVNVYQQPGSSHVIGWKLEVGVAS